jgi:hypothetical protein
VYCYSPYFSFHHGWHAYPLHLGFSAKLQDESGFHLAEKRYRGSCLLGRPLRPTTHSDPTRQCAVVSPAKTISARSARCNPPSWPVTASAAAYLGGRERDLQPDLLIFAVAGSTQRSEVGDVSNGGGAAARPYPKSRRAELPRQICIPQSQTPI